MSLDMFLVGDVTLFLENYIMSQEGFNYGTQFSQLLFKVLENVSILLDFGVFLPIVYHLWLLRLIGIIAFGIHGVHGLWDSVTAGGNEGSFSFVETL